MYIKRFMDVSDGETFADVVYESGRMYLEIFTKVQSGQCGGMNAVSQDDGRLIRIDPFSDVIVVD